MAADERIRVAVNGYGVIGKRVADAVTLQEDMRLAEIADIVFDYRTRVAVERGYPVYAAMPERRGEMAAAGIPVAGTLDDLLRQADVVVDCTPKRIASQTGTATAAHAGFREKGFAGSEEPTEPLGSGVQMGRR